MHGWLPHIAVYLAVYSTILLTVYVLAPVVARRWVAAIVLQAYQKFRDDAREIMTEHLRSGKKMLIPAGQASIVGHMIEPYLEKFGHWMMTKIDEHGHDRVVHACTEVCLKQLLRWRLTIALATAQLVGGIMAIGSLLHGVI